MSDRAPSSAGPRLERVLPATPDEVFDAWTNPELMATWLSPTGHAEVEADVRVGGSFRLVMVGDGMRIDHSGEYLEVDRPHKLSFSWVSEYTGGEPSVVTVLFSEHGDGTRLVLTHEHLPTDSADSHAGGWGSILDNLARVLVSSRVSPAVDR